MSRLFVRCCFICIYSVVAEKADIQENSADRVFGDLVTFLEPIASDCQYFVYNQRTYGNESFHNVSNCYYQKGSSVPFDIFVMKRQFACFDWNEQMRNNAVGIDQAELQKWQIRLLDLLEQRLRA